MSLKRININMDAELLEVLDAFAKMNDRTRTYVIHELLMPSVPTLKQLLKMASDLAKMSDSERLTALGKLAEFEGALTETALKIPNSIEEVTK